MYLNDNHSLLKKLQKSIIKALRKKFIVTPEETESASEYLTQKEMYSFSKYGYKFADSEFFIILGQTPLSYNSQLVNKLNFNIKESNSSVFFKAITVYTDDKKIICLDLTDSNNKSKDKPAVITELQKNSAKRIKINKEKHKRLNINKRNIVLLIVAVTGIVLLLWLFANSSFFTIEKQAIEQNKNKIEQSVNQKKNDLQKTSETEKYDIKKEKMFDFNRNETNYRDVLNLFFTTEKSGVTATERVYHQKESTSDYHIPKNSSQTSDTAEYTESTHSSSEPMPESEISEEPVEINPKIYFPEIN